MVWMTISLVFFFTTADLRLMRHNHLLKIVLKTLYSLTRKGVYFSNQIIFN